MLDIVAESIRLTVLGQVEPEIERGLEQDEDEHGRRRRPGHRDGHTSDDDREVQDHEPAVRARSSVR